MKYEVDSYLFYQHPFRVRQHLVNHVDMIFGLGREEHSNSSDGRLLLVGDAGRCHISHLWEFDDARIARTRSWVLGESLFATGYEQVYPLHDGECFVPGDLSDDGEREELLWECVDILIYEQEGPDGDYDAFIAKTAAVVLFSEWEPIVALRVVVRKRPSGDEHLPVALNSRKVMQRKHGGSTAWNAFSSGVCKNEYMKRELVHRQEKKCPACDEVIARRAVVHHVDYDHECGLALAGGKWLRRGSHTVPDCGTCYLERPDLFEECASRLRAVHVGCNYLLDATQ